MSYIPPHLRDDKSSDDSKPARTNKKGASDTEKQENSTFVRNKYKPRQERDTPSFFQRKSEPNSNHKDSRNNIRDNINYLKRQDNKNKIENNVDDNRNKNNDNSNDFTNKNKKEIKKDCSNNSKTEIINDWTIENKKEILNDWNNKSKNENDWNSIQTENKKEFSFEKTSQKGEYKSFSSNNNGNSEWKTEKKTYENSNFRHHEKSKTSENVNSAWSSRGNNFSIYDESSYDEEIYEDTKYYIDNRKDADILYDEVKCDKNVTQLSKFTDLKLPMNFFNHLNKYIPTSIQAFAIPAILTNKNVLARAPTGLGKTLSFLVPLMLKLNYTKKPKLRILILTPTRELALQIKNELDKLISNKTITEENENILPNAHLKAVAIYGGTDEAKSRASLSTGCDIIVATPGRLCDFIERKIISLKNVKFFVMDEADRMLDMGFEKEMNFIRNELKYREKQLFTYMFSATFEKRLAMVVTNYLGSDRINIVFENETIKNIKQEIKIVNKFDKKDELIKILKKDDFKNKKVLVFVETKLNCRNIENYINYNGIKAVSLHGDKSQYDRELALHKFTKNESFVLVATSVASRGLDIPMIELVINFDMPKDIKEYIHRIGRSGRCGKKGMAISFYCNDDLITKESLIDVLKESENEIPDFLCDNRRGDSNIRNYKGKGNSFEKKTEINYARRESNQYERGNNKQENSKFYENKKEFFNEIKNGREFINENKNGREFINEIKKDLNNEKKETSDKSA
ncbi:putative ATP-dependent RNA helicase ddx4 [Gurleya vavrai]